MGKLFHSIFQDHAANVVSTRTEKTTQAQREENRRVILQADLVVFCVPLSATVEIIENCAEFIDEQHVVFDLSSLKVAPVRAMPCQTRQMHIQTGLGPNWLRNCCC